jgi:hypothetical protein
MKEKYFLYFNIKYNSRHACSRIVMKKLNLHYLFQIVNMLSYSITDVVEFTSNRCLFLTSLHFLSLRGNKLITIFYFQFLFNASNPST